MNTDEYDDVEALFRLILERDGTDGLIRAATLTVLQYAQICGHGITRGKRLFVVDPANGDKADAP